MLAVLFLTASIPSIRVSAFLSAGRKGQSPESLHFRGDRLVSVTPVCPKGAFLVVFNSYRLSH